MCGAAVFPAVNSTNFPSGSYTGGPGLALPYRFFKPIGYNAADTQTKYPLVIFLHGDGEKGTDNTKQLNNNANGSMIFISSAAPDNQSANPCFWVAPQFQDRNPDQVEGLVVDFINRFNIDPDRIYLTGLSGGGAFVWNILSKFPDRYAAAAAICGWGTNLESVHRQVPIWVFHCADDGTVTVAGSDDAVGRLRTAGGDPIYTRYTTGGHGGAWSRAYSDSCPLVPWMMSRTRRGTHGISAPGILVNSPVNGSNAFYQAGSVASLAGTIQGGNTGVTWQNLRTGKSGTGTGAESWSIPSLPLIDGMNICRLGSKAVLFGSPGNGETTFSHTVAIYSASKVDNSPPLVTIHSPIDGPIFNSPLSRISLSGTASDETAVTRVVWSNDRTGGGVAADTSDWSVSHIDLRPGVNKLTITATDAAGNTASDSIAVSYSSQNQAPIVRAGSDQFLVHPDRALLYGRVVDDGLAPGSATTRLMWSKISGPGAVEFVSPSSSVTEVSFGAAGCYRLRLGATDEALSAWDEIKVLVLPVGTRTRTLRFDFGASGWPTSGNWNNVTDVSAGLRIPDAIDSTGLGTGLALRIGMPFEGVNTSGSISETGLYVVSAMRDSFYVQNARAARIALEKLSHRSSYHLTFFASRLDTGTNRVTSYGSGPFTTSLDATNNSSRASRLKSLAPSAASSIGISIRNQSSNGYGYLGVMEIEIVPASSWKSWGRSIFGEAPPLEEEQRIMADPDGDGLPNLLEYALGGDPGASSCTDSPILKKIGGEWMLVFRRPAFSDLLYSVEASSDLKTWRPIADYSVGDPMWTGDALVGEVVAGDMREVSIKPASGDDHYFRLRVQIGKE